jgi:SH3-like domain-containing protein
MSLGDRLREMLDPGANSAAGAGAPNGPTRRRSRSQQAAPLGGTTRNYDTEPGRPMPRAQWIGLGLAAAVAVALTAGLVFAILTITRPSAATATPTPLPVVASPTTASSIAAIFASPTAATAIAPAASPTPQGVGQRLQVANTGGGGANMRREPGQTGERIKVVADGGLVDVIGPDQTLDGTAWRNVRDLQGDTGWIAASLLAPEGSVPAAAAAPGSSLNPSAPSGAAPPATSAPRPTAAAASSSAAAGRAQVGNTGGQGANVRSEPGSGGRILKTLGEGAAIDVLGPEREIDGVIWRQVRDSAGVTGWIIRGAVAPAGSVPTPAPVVTRAPAAPAGPTTAPAAKPIIGATPKPTGGNPTPKPSGGNATPTAAPKPDGDLPIIIQPATPRPSGGTPSGGTTPTPAQ